MKIDVRLTGSQHQSARYSATLYVSPVDEYALSNGQYNPPTALRLKVVAFASTEELATRRLKEALRELAQTLTDLTQT